MIDVNLTHLAFTEIRSDLIRRMDSAKFWLDEDNNTSSVEDSPSLSPTRSKRKRSLPQAGPVTVAAKPLLSPNRSPRKKSVDQSQGVLKQSNRSPTKYNSGDDDAHIPSQPAEGLPDGWVTRKVPRKNPKDSRVDTRVSNVIEKFSCIFKAYKVLISSYKYI